jgi:hypothetical protein
MLSFKDAGKNTKKNSKIEFKNSIHRAKNSILEFFVRVFPHPRRKTKLKRAIIEK